MARIVIIDDEPAMVEVISYAKGDKADHELANMPVGRTLDDFIQHQERHYIEATLTHCDGSREKTANMLGISMATLYRKIEPKEK
jgi:DNA-binding NtrC family response regulator